MKIHPFTNLRGEDLRDVNLNGADIRHSDLESANLMEVNLQRAVLIYSNARCADFISANLEWADLRNANLECSDFSGANLQGADISHANLECSDFSGANLQRADISHANIYNASFPNARLKGIRHEYNVPVIENIHAKVLEAVTAKYNELFMIHWHSCETTHCYAGWVIHLAGEQGYALEDQVGPSAAAALIMQASDPDLEQIPDWHQSEDDALKQMRALAEKEAA